MADLTVEALLEVFERHETIRGWDGAMAWLHSEYCVASAPVKAGAVLRLGRRNLDRIRIGEATLTGNRRRPGIF